MQQRLKEMKKKMRHMWLMNSRKREGTEGEILWELV
jgi:hypothetical protein